jgi:hypothetical protein
MRPAPFQYTGHRSWCSPDFISTTKVSRPSGGLADRQRHPAPARADRQRAADQVRRARQQGAQGVVEPHEQPGADQGEQQADDPAAAGREGDPGLGQTNEQDDEDDQQPDDGDGEVGELAGPVVGSRGA